MSVEEKRSIMFNFIPTDYKLADIEISYLHPGMSLRHVIPIADPEGQQLKLVVRDVKNYFFNVWASMHTNCEYYTLHSDPVVIGKNAEYGPSMLNLTYTDPITENQFSVMKSIEILEEGKYLEYVSKKIITEEVFDDKHCQTEHFAEKEVNWWETEEFADDFSSSSDDETFDLDNFDWDEYEQELLSDLYKEDDIDFDLDEAGLEIGDFGDEDFDENFLDEEWLNEDWNDEDWLDDWDDEDWFDDWDDEDWLDEDWLDDWDEDWDDDWLGEDSDGHNPSGTKGSNNGGKKNSGKG